jgi:hypothetical protein
MQAWNQWSNQATAAAVAAAGFPTAGYASTAAAAQPTAAAAAPQTAYPIGYQYYGTAPAIAPATPVSAAPFIFIKLC